MMRTTNAAKGHPTTPLDVDGWFLADKDYFIESIAVMGINRIQCCG